MVVPIGAGAVLGYVCEPPIEWVERKLGKIGTKLRWPIAVTFVVLVLATFLVPMTLAGYSAVRQLYRFLSHTDFDQVVALPMKYLAWASWKLAQYGVDVPMEQPIQKLRETGLDVASRGAAYTGDALSGAPNFLFNVTITLLAWAVFAAEGPHMRAVLLPKLIPWPKERQIIAHTTGEVLRGAILANIAVAAVQALLALGFLIAFQVPNAFSLGVLGFFLSFIPVFGTAPVTVGASLYLFAQNRDTAGIVMLGVAVAVGAIDNVIRPIVMKGSAELSFFWGTIALVGGVAQFGPAGIIIGPLFFSLLVAFLDAFDYADDIPGIKINRPVEPDIIPATRRGADLQEPRLDGEQRVSRTPGQSLDLGDSPGDDENQ